MSLFGTLSKPPMAHPAAWNGWIDFDGLLLSRPKSAALAVKCEDLFVSVVLSVSVHGDECVSFEIGTHGGTRTR